MKRRVKYGPHSSRAHDCSTCQLLVCVCGGSYGASSKRERGLNDRLHLSQVSQLKLLGTRGFTPPTSKGFRTSPPYS